MGLVGWPLGLFLSAISSVFGILGKLLLKLAHNAQAPPKMTTMATTTATTSTTTTAAAACSYYYYFYGGLASMLVLNPALGAVAYCFATPSLLAPMAGLTIMWNTLLGPVLLPHERLTTRDFVGAALIFAGCVLVGVSGSHGAPPVPVEDLPGRFRTAPFLVYALALLLLVACLVHHAWPALRSLVGHWGHAPLSPKDQAHAPVTRAAMSVLAGLTSGQLFFLAATMQLLRVHHATTPIWSHPVTYVCILGAISTALLGLYLLNAALRIEDAVVVIYLYEAAYILAGAVSGLCFFQDMDRVPAWHYVVYALSLALILLGIHVVARRDAHGRRHWLREDEQENLLPLLGPASPSLSPSPPPPPASMGKGNEHGRLAFKAPEYAWGRGRTEVGTPSTTLPGAQSSLPAPPPSAPPIGTDRRSASATRLA